MEPPFIPPGLPPPPAHLSPAYSHPCDSLLLGHPCGQPSRQLPYWSFISHDPPRHLPIPCIPLAWSQPPASLPGAQAPLARSPGFWDSGDLHCSITEAATLETASSQLPSLVNAAPPLQHSLHLLPASGESQPTLGLTGGVRVPSYCCQLYACPGQLHGSLRGLVQIWASSVWSQGLVWGPFGVWGSLLSPDILQASREL